MSSFKDEQNRPWSVRIDVVNAQEIKSLYDIDLLDIEKMAENMFRLANEPITLVNILYLLCEEQAKERNISDKDFGRLLAGDVLGEATRALEVANVNFFPPKRRSVLQRLQEKIDQTENLRIGMVTKKMEDKDFFQKVEATMQAELDSMTNKALARMSSATD